LSSPIRERIYFLCFQDQILKTVYPKLGYPLEARNNSVTLKDIAYRNRYRDFLLKLREARIGADLTQIEVAKRLGRPQSFVSKCESGERRVDVVELREFSRIYGKPLSFFVT
jgi:ribosome-binding protein aMBF1 (putative translation factor)